MFHSLLSVINLLALISCEGCIMYSLSITYPPGRGGGGHYLLPHQGGEGEVITDPPGRGGGLITFQILLVFEPRKIKVDDFDTRNCYNYIEGGKGAVISANLQIFSCLSTAKYKSIKRAQFVVVTVIKWCTTTPGFKRPPSLRPRRSFLDVTHISMVIVI